MKKVLVVGYARSGKYVALLLHKEGYAVTITDIRAIDDKAELLKAGIMVFDEGHPWQLASGDWDFIVKNPGIPYHMPFIQELLKHRQIILTEIEVAARFVSRYEYAAITGTNGKTTITTLLHELLRAEFAHSYAAGNIGIPLSELVYEKGDIAAKIALEISGFQLLGTESFKPRVSVITNLTPDHLDYYDSLDDYYRSKLLVYKNQNGDDWFIQNTDDEEIMNYTRDIPCQVIELSLQNKKDLYLDKEDVYLFDTYLFSRHDLQLVGEHNLFNAMVAAAMAYKLGVKPASIKAVIRQFKGVEHRIEFVRELKGVRYYNDSKATNVDSTITALKAFSQPVILIAGGYDKKTGFKELQPYMDKVKKLVVYGETSKQLQELKEDSIVLEDLAGALDYVSAFVQQGDTVLFSPACASYDQYLNFEERGVQFKDLVNSLPAA